MFLTRFWITLISACSLAYLNTSLKHYGHLIQSLSILIHTECYEMSIFSGGWWVSPHEMYNENICDIGVLGENKVIQKLAKNCLLPDEVKKVTYIGMSYLKKIDKHHWICGWKDSLIQWLIAKILAVQVRTLTVGHPVLYVKKIPEPSGLNG